MSPYKPIKTLEVGEEVSQVFLVASVEGRVTQNGNPFARVTLKDKDAQITTNLWDFDLAVNPELVAGAYVQMTIQVEEYRGFKQAKSKSLPMLLATPDDVDKAVYVNHECDNW